MDMQDIKTHWTDWATTYGGSTRATTLSQIAKDLEIAALERVFRNIMAETSVGCVLEAGCGNGANLIELSRRFPEIWFQGFDIVPEMIAAANERPDRKRIIFFEGDVLEPMPGSYDIVFTDRCIINLNDIALQKQAISNLANQVRPGGYLLMIENSLTMRSLQNECRAVFGLEARPPAPFNLFLNEPEIVGYMHEIGFGCYIEDFSGLHDLVLYVLLPSINGGKIEYEHPLVEAAAKLSMAMPRLWPPFGQNRLFICRKP